MREKKAGGGGGVRLCSLTAPQRGDSENKHFTQTTRSSAPRRSAQHARLLLLLIGLKKSPSVCFDRGVRARLPPRLRFLPQVSRRDATAFIGFASSCRITTMRLSG